MLPEIAQSRWIAWRPKQRLETSAPARIHSKEVSGHRNVPKEVRRERLLEGVSLSRPTA